MTKYNKEKTKLIKWNNFLSKIIVIGKYKLFWEVFSITELKQKLNIILVEKLKWNYKCCFGN